MKFLKELKKTILLKDLIYILVGVIMILIPGFLSDFMCYILGILLLFIGGSSLYRQFNGKGNNSNLLLVLSILSIILALIIMFNSITFVSLLPIGIGAYIMVLATLKLQQALQFKKANYNSWYSILIASILLYILGIVIIFNAYESLKLAIRLLGVIFIINSIYDIYNVYSYQKGFKDLKKDINNLFK